MSIKETFGFIEFSSTASMCDRHEPEDYVTEFNGNIVVFDNQFNEVDAGTINGKLFAIGNVVNDNRSMIETVDSSIELEEMMSYVWNYKSNTFKASAIGEDNYAIDSVIIIDEILIKPMYSGNNYALHAIQTTVGHWCKGTNWLLLLKASPLQHCLRTSDDIIDKFDLGRFSDEEKEATSKLITHYSKIGLESIDDTNFMYVNSAYKTKFKI